MPSPLMGDQPRAMPSPLTEEGKGGGDERLDTRLNRGVRFGHLQWQEGTPMRANLVLVMAVIGLIVAPVGATLAQQPPITDGSGFLVDPRGYLFTAAHVVEQSWTKKIEVVVGGRQRYLAEVLRTDETNDLALLKLDGKDLPVVKLGRAETAKRQESVWVIGYPLGLQEISTASEQITAFRTEPKQIDPRLQVARLIEIGARVNPGNSGGPLVNDLAEAIGVVTAKI